MHTLILYNLKHFTVCTTQEIHFQTFSIYLWEVVILFLCISTYVSLIVSKFVNLELQRKVEKKHKVEELSSFVPPACSCSPAQSHLIRLLQGFRIDLTCKQLTVDFVNQSVLQMSSHDVEGKRSDKTDFAEKLGAMNRRWQILQGLIGEKVTLREN